MRTRNAVGVAAAVLVGLVAWADSVNMPHAQARLVFQQRLSSYDAVESCQTASQVPQPVPNGYPQIWTLVSSMTPSPDGLSQPTRDLRLFQLDVAGIVVRSTLFSGGYVGGHGALAKLPDDSTVLAFNRNNGLGARAYVARVAKDGTLLWEVPDGTPKTELTAAVGRADAIFTVGKRTVGALDKGLLQRRDLQGARQAEALLADNTSVRALTLLPSGLAALVTDNAGKSAVVYYNDALAETARYDALALNVAGLVYKGGSLYIASANPSAAEWTITQLDATGAQVAERTFKFRSGNTSTALHGITDLGKGGIGLFGYGPDGNYYYSGALLTADAKLNGQRLYWARHGYSTDLHTACFDPELGVIAGGQFYVQMGNNYEYGGFLSSLD